MTIQPPRRAIAGLAFALMGHLGGLAHADPAGLRLPKLFSDHMVLQQEKPIRIWGFDAPDREVTVSFKGQSRTTTSDKEGQWRVELPPMKVDGRKHELTVTGSTTLTLRNVVLGEVWICSGQSNMAWGAGPALCKEAKHPGLRLFCTASRLIPLERDLALPTGWAECRPETLAQGGSRILDPETGAVKRIAPFSRVGYQFGRDLHKDLGVPVGMVKASIGGSIMAAWTPHEACERDFPFGEEMPLTANGIKRHPGAIHHLIVRPITPLSVRGVIWFQGESDADNPRFERELRDLITLWRKEFEDPEMHFHMVQLSPSSFRGGMLGAWEAQSRVVAALPNCGIAVTNDIYPEDKFRSVDPETGWPLQGREDPHPPRHEIIARRLADLCLRNVYGRTTREACGPMLKSHEIRDGRVIVTFANAGGGLKAADGKELVWFEVSDGSRKDGSGPYVYNKAVARVVGKDQVEVQSPEVASPRFIRFCWHMLARNNLVNSEGLPGFPFRTDDHRDTRER